MKEKMLALLEDIRPDVDFNTDEKLMDDGVLDSFDVISIVSAMEENFGVEVSEDDLETENFNSVDAMIALVEKLKK